MTRQTRNVMVMQALGFAVYWPVTSSLANGANHPPPAVLAASALLSLILGVGFVTANLCRDRCFQNPVTRALYNSFQFFAATTSLSIVSLAAAACRMLRMPAAERDGVRLMIISVMTAIIGISVLTLCWSLLRWWLSRPREA